MKSLILLVLTCQTGIPVMQKEVADRIKFDLHVYHLLN